MAGGRPTACTPEAIAMAKGAYAMGAKDIEVAALLGVVEATIYNWKISHPEFLEATKAWKEFADDRVERSLYEKANGYSHPDTDIRVVDGDIVMTPIVKHYPPSDVAMIFWLKNRRRGDWRDRIDHNHSGTLGQMTDEQVEERHQELMRKAQEEKAKGK